MPRSLPHLAFATIPQGAIAISEQSGHTLCVFDRDTFGRPPQDEPFGRYFVDGTGKESSVVVVDGTPQNVACPASPGLVLVLTDLQDRQSLRRFLQSRRGVIDVAWLLFGEDELRRQSCADVLSHFLFDAPVVSACPGTGILPGQIHLAAPGLAIAASGNGFVADASEGMGSDNRSAVADGIASLFESLPCEYGRLVTVLVPAAVSEAQAARFAQLAARGAHLWACDATRTAAPLASDPPARRGSPDANHTRRVESIPEESAVSPVDSGRSASPGTVPVAAVPRPISPFPFESNGRKKLEEWIDRTDMRVLMLSAELRLECCSAGMAQWLGLTEADYGRPFSELLGPLTSTEILLEMRRVQELQRPREFELRTDDNDWKLIKLRMIHRGDEPPLIAIEVIDVNFCHRSMSQAERLSALLESSGDAIVGRDLSGVILSWNPAAEALYGYSAEEVRGKHIGLILPPGEEDDAVVMARRAASGDVGVTLETTRVHKDGSLIDVAVRVSPIYDLSGELVGVTAISRDIRGQKQAERALAKLALVATHATNAVIITDARGRIEWVNDAFTQLTEYTLDEVRLLKPSTVLQGPETDPKTVAFMRNAIREGRAFSADVVNYTKSGRKYWVSVQCQPIFDDKGGITSFIAVQSDITRLKQVEADAMDAIRRRDHFLAMLSHELRNPLGAIVNANELLQREMKGSRIETGIIDRQAQHVARLLDDLLDVARFSQDRIELRRRTLDLRETVGESIECLERCLGDRGIVLRKKSPDSPVWVLGDRVRLIQIQINLLANAAKFTPPGGVITHKIQVLDERAVIEVSDTGVGIDPSQLDVIFEPFVQLASATGMESGVGVGLSLAKSLTLAHGGTISAHSEGSGAGATFRVELPLANLPAATLSAATLSAATLSAAIPVPAILPAATLSATRTMPVLADTLNRVPSSTRLPSPSITAGRIVLIDDMEDARCMLRYLLESEGFEVVDCANGLSGYEAILEQRPEIAIVDVGLPDISGYEVARKVRADAGCQPRMLIALTGYAQRADREAAIAAGFDVHLAKPVDPRNLLRLLGSAIVQQV